MRTFMTMPLVAASLCLPPAFAAAQDKDTVQCMSVPEPVVSLSYGSRYTDESADRSDISEASNAEVNEALSPIDDFIQDLAAKANDATRGDSEAADCVVEAIEYWARADALSDLKTMNARISSPARIAGIAMAYLQVVKVGDVDPEIAEHDRQLARCPCARRGGLFRPRRAAGREPQQPARLGRAGRGGSRRVDRKRLSQILGGTHHCRDRLPSRRGRRLAA